jgi:AcrR family transcriptional regulator
MTDETRRYEKKRRAELEAETRRRITESAVQLHASLGPSRTSISAVAQRAGVRRSTVYRHFPDEAALFNACSTHWGEANPVPDLGGWVAIGDPGERLRTALGELYAFYRRTEHMLVNLYRDEATMPVVRERFAGFHGYIDAARDLLVRGRPERGRRRNEVRAAIGHALAFTTWRSLTREQGLEDDQAVELMCALAGLAGVRNEGRRSCR